MSNDGRIYITITDSPVSSVGNGGTGSGQGRVKDSTGVEKQLREIDLIRHQVNNFTIDQAKQVAAYAINNIGNFSGDYNAQRSIQHTVQIGSKMLGIGMAFATSGPLGIMATIATGIGFIEQEYANQFAIKKQNYTINRLRDISGLDNLTNGSR